MLPRPKTTRDDEELLLSTEITPEVQQSVLDTMAHYAMAVDRGDHEQLYATFAPDGGIKHPNGETFLGRQRLHEWMDMVAMRPDHGGRQHITPARKWEANPDGSLKVYSYYVYFIHRTEDGDPRIGGQGYYADTLVEHEGRWVFKERYIDHWNDERAFMSPNWVQYKG